MDGAQQVTTEREQQRQKNRDSAPNVAAVVDMFNEYFGPVKVLAAEDLETGAKFGEFRDERKASEG